VLAREPWRGLAALPCARGISSTTTAAAQSGRVSTSAATLINEHGGSTGPVAWQCFSGHGEPRTPQHWRATHAPAQPR